MSTNAGEALGAAAGMNYDVPNGDRRVHELDMGLE